MLDRVTTHDPPTVSRARVRRLLEARVHRLQAAEELDEFRRQALEGSDLAGEKRVTTGERVLEAFTASVRLCDEEESRQARRLELVRYVAVP